jgi:hypothetical protein
MSAALYDLTQRNIQDDLNIYSHLQNESVNPDRDIFPDILRIIRNINIRTARAKCKGFNVNTHANIRGYTEL